MYYMGCRSPREKGTFGESGSLKTLVLHRILGLGKRVSCIKKQVDQSKDPYVI